MEKLDYKEKYEQALERCREFYNKLGNAQLKKEVEEIFPELKESEDERIRKEILNLSKQLDEGTTIRGRSYDYAKWIAWLEKQGKQMPTDKVESKFKVGDWIVQEGVGTYKVVEVCKWYEVIGIDGNQYSISFLQENGCHLWTIRDAKDGDVLTVHMSPEGDWIGIYKQFTDDTFKTHCYINSIGEFVTNPNRCTNHGTYGLHPATKEQRDLLFLKMKEAGYEWDAEKKELIEFPYNNPSDTLENKWKKLCRLVAFPKQKTVEPVTVIERDGEQWVRVCALGEDFIIAAHDYREGDKTEFTWEEACKIGTFSKKQGCIILALLNEINAKLEEIGGEPLDSHYWSSSEYNSTYAWNVNFNSGAVNKSYKYTSYVARAVAAF